MSSDPQVCSKKAISKWASLENLYLYVILSLLGEIQPKKLMPIILILFKCQVILKHRRVVYYEQVLKI